MRPTKDRDDWIRKLEQRQDNIDPIRRIPNAALFQGTLINGNLRLNAMQRVGAILFGVTSLATGFVMIATAADELFRKHLPDIEIVLFCPLTFWFGWKVLKHAIVNDPDKVRRAKLAK